MLFSLLHIFGQSKTFCQIETKNSWNFLNMLKIVNMKLNFKSLINILSSLLVNYDGYSVSCESDGDVYVLFWLFGKSLSQGILSKWTGSFLYHLWILDSWSSWLVKDSKEMACEWFQVVVNVSLWDGDVLPAWMGVVLRPFLKRPTLNPTSMIIFVLSPAFHFLGNQQEFYLPNN